MPEISTGHLHHKRHQLRACEPVKGRHQTSTMESSMTLLQVIKRRNRLRGQGIKCQIKHEGDQVWKVHLAGNDY